MNKLMNRKMMIVLVAGLAMGASAQSDSPREGRRDGALRGPDTKPFVLDGAERDRPARFGDRGPQRRGAERGEGAEGRRGPGMGPELLEQFDTDGDGKLSETEREAVKAHMEAKKAAFIKKYDLDADGALNDEETAAMKATIKEKMEAMKAELLTKFDADGDGELTGEERKAAGEAARPLIAEITGGFGMFGRGQTQGDKSRRGPQNAESREAMKEQILENFDADGDGKLSETERKAAGEAMRSKRGGEGRQGRASFGQDREAMKAQILEKFDTDGDGKLDETERKAAGEAMRSNRGPRGERSDRGQRRQNWVDANGDGTIDASELAIAADAVSKGERKADFNRDGEVNSDDLVFLTKKSGGL